MNLNQIHSVFVGWDSLPCSLRHFAFLHSVCVSAMCLVCGSLVHIHAYCTHIALVEGTTATWESISRMRQTLRVRMCWWNVILRLFHFTYSTNTCQRFNVVVDYDDGCCYYWYCLLSKWVCVCECACCDEGFCVCVVTHSHSNGGGDCYCYAYTHICTTSTPIHIHNQHTLMSAIALRDQ